MGVRLVVNQPVDWLEGIRIDYNLTPQQTVGLLSGSNPYIAEWPESIMGLWHGGKVPGKGEIPKDGIVEGATLPILWGRQSFTTAEGRQKQSGIGFGWPVEIASLALPENEPEQIRKGLYGEGMRWLVVLRQSDEELWQLYGYFRPFCLCLCPHYFFFYLDCADFSWGATYALVGAPQ